MSLSGSQSTVPPMLLPVLLMCLGFAGPAGAQGLPPAARTLVSVPLQAPPAPNHLGERAERLWHGLLGLFGQMEAPRLMPTTAAPVSPTDADDFGALMDVAGFGLRRIETTVGLVPHLSFTFGHSRELTDGDREYLERHLARHALRNPGPVGLVQRAIVRGVIDATELGHFQVEEVHVTLAPLPSIAFVAAPANAPLRGGLGRVMAAIDRIEARLTRLAPPDAGPQPVQPDLRPLRLGTAAALR